MSHMHESLRLVNFTCHACMSYNLNIVEHVSLVCVLGYSGIQMASLSGHQDVKVNLPNMRAW